MHEVEWLLPFQFMEVGESFFLPSLCPEELLYVVDTRAKAAKVKVKAYITTHEGLLGVRVWRMR